MIFRTPPLPLLFDFETLCLIGHVTENYSFSTLCLTQNLTFGKNTFYFYQPRALFQPARQTTCGRILGVLYWSLTIKGCTRIHDSKIIGKICTIKWKRICPIKWKRKFGLLNFYKIWCVYFPTSFHDTCMVHSLYIYRTQNNIQQNFHSSTFVSFTRQITMIIEKHTGELVVFAMACSIKL